MKIESITREVGVTITTSSSKYGMADSNMMRLREVAIEEIDNSVREGCD